jgi:ubiquinone/menaquinone biosynthesis C-methylase UbiE
MPVSGAITAASPLSVLDRYVSPALLAPFAEDMARRAARLGMGPVLETSAGTGVLTQAMGLAMARDVSIIATDPDPDTVAYAAAKPGMGRVRWQTADPESLPFPDGTFGVVANHFGVAGLGCRVQAFREARRVMKPGGALVFSVPGHIRHNPVARCVQDAIDALFAGDTPRFLSQVLHGYADTETIDDELTAAGFTEAVYAAVELPFAAASAHEVAIGYCLGTPLRTEIEARMPGDSERVIGAVATAVETCFGGGPVVTGMRALMVVAAG